MLTPASMATSPRRSPGTRRDPTSGRPAWRGVTLARREVRKFRTSTRLSMRPTVGRARPAWESLRVHLRRVDPPSPARSDEERCHPPALLEVGHRLRPGTLHVVAELVDRVEQR